MLASQLRQLPRRVFRNDHYVHPKPLRQLFYKDGAPLLKRLGEGHMQKQLPRIRPPAHLADLLPKAGPAARFGG